MRIVPESQQRTTIGKRYGSLVILGPEFNIPPSRYRTVVARCDCGTVTATNGYRVAEGRVTSCGCTKTHGHASRKRKQRDRLYVCWYNMRKRCRGAAERYASWSGRGISVCDEWDSSFEAFRDWAQANGYRDDLTIDRIDNDGNYEPGNCRWATASQQAANKTTTPKYHAFGEEKSLREWADDERCAVKYSALFRRLSRGWSFERALTQPARKSVNGKYVTP